VVAMSVAIPVWQRRGFKWVLSLDSRNETTRQRKPNRSLTILEMNPPGRAGLILLKIESYCVSSVGQRARGGKTSLVRSKIGRAQPRCKPSIASLHDSALLYTFTNDIRASSDGKRLSWSSLITWGLWGRMDGSSGSNQCTSFLKRLPRYIGRVSS
jgi:hypothetical protein